MNQKEHTPTDPPDFADHAVAPPECKELRLGQDRRGARLVPKQGVLAKVVASTKGAESARGAVSVTRDRVASDVLPELLFSVMIQVAGIGTRMQIGPGCHEKSDTFCPKHLAIREANCT